MANITLSAVCLAYSQAQGQYLMGTRLSMSELGARPQKFIWRLGAPGAAEVPPLKAESVWLLDLLRYWGGGGGALRP